jgi:putative AlgH/UPF0301 family transcriptional regulator
MSRVGKLLIANPNFPSESPFAKSVIYIYQDDEMLAPLVLFLISLRSLFLDSVI